MTGTLTRGPNITPIINAVERRPTDPARDHLKLNLAYIKAAKHSPFHEFIHATDPPPNLT